MASPRHSTFLEIGKTHRYTLASFWPSSCDLSTPEIELNTKLWSNVLKRMACSYEMGFKNCLLHKWHCSKLIAACWVPFKPCRLWNHHHMCDNYQTLQWIYSLIGQLKIYRFNKSGICRSNKPDKMCFISG